jgi:hypothetical protein
VGLYVRLPPRGGGLSGLAGVTTRPAGYPSGGVPPAVERQLHLLTSVGRVEATHAPVKFPLNETRFAASDVEVRGRPATVGIAEWYPVGVHGSTTAAACGQHNIVKCRAPWAQPLGWCTWRKRAERSLPTAGGSRLRAAASQCEGGTDDRPPASRLSVEEAFPPLISERATLPQHPSLR